MNTLLQDLRYGWRQLWKHSGFTTLAIVSMALGIGANTAIFSLVDTVLLRPLPVKDPSQLMELYGTQHQGADITLQSYLNYKDYRDRNTVLSGLIAYRLAVTNMSHGGTNERAWGYLVSGNYFDVLGVKPILGRGFLPEEDKTPGAKPVTVLSYATWQKLFAADSTVIGRTVTLNGRAYTIVGVAPKGFVGTEVAYAPQMWVPIMMAKEIELGSHWLDSRDSDNLFTVGRLKPGVSTKQAEAALSVLTAQLAKEYPKDDGGRGVRLIPPGLFIPSIRNAVFAFSSVLAVVGGLVLLLACVNLANLLLARAAGRRKEIAIRLAVGASRSRLVRQLLTESVMLSLAGGGFGLLLASWINHAVSSLKLPSDFDLLFDVRLDSRVLLFTLGLSVLTGVLFSLIPALQSSKPELVPALKEESSLAGFRRSRLRNSLVVLQIALSLLLLVSAGLIVRSLQAAQHLRPGFNPEHAAAISFDVALQGYDEAKGRAFYTRVLEEARALPGITSAALTENLPLSLDYNATSIYIEGQASKSSSDLPFAIPRDVGPGYFTTMEIRLRGRDFSPNENKTESRVAIVSETFARRFFPGRKRSASALTLLARTSPIGRSSGSAGDGKYNSLGEDPTPAVYRPLLRDYVTPVTLVARGRASSETLLATIKSETQKLDPSLTIFVAKTLEEHMNIPLFPARMAASTLGSFGVLALVLAAVGIYGVMSYVVAGRTREIGLRMALGAQSENIRGLILRQGMVLASLGAVIGLVMSFGATRMLKTLLYGVSAVDPMTFVVVTLLLGFVTFLACWIPAHRATRVDPMVTLRAE